MAYEHISYPSRSAVRETIALFGNFQGAGAADPVDLSGGLGGLTATRTGVGTYQVPLPATYLGFTVSIDQQVGTNYTRTVHAADGALVITTKNPEAGSPYDPVDLSANEFLVVTVFVTNARL